MQLPKRLGTKSLSPSIALSHVAQGMHVPLSAEEIVGRSKRLEAGLLPSICLVWTRLMNFSSLLTNASKPMIGINSGLLSSFLANLNQSKVSFALSG